MSLMLQDGKLLIVSGKLAMHERCCCAGCCCDSSDHDITIAITLNETNPGGGSNCPDPVGDHTAIGTITGGPDGSGGCSYTGEVTGGGNTWLVCLTCGEFGGDEWVVTAALNAGSCSDLDCAGSADTSDGGGLYVSCSGGDPSTLSGTMDLVDGATTIGSMEIVGTT